MVINKYSEAAFFTLLRSALWDEVVPQYTTQSQYIDWEQVLELAQQQTVSGLIIEAILNLPTIQQPPRDILVRIAGLQASIRSTNALVNEVAGKVSDKLSAAGMHPILLKGQGLAHFYPQPSLRVCGDVDMYVGTEDYKRACELVLDTLATPDSLPEESDKHLHTTVDGVAVEIHRVAETLFCFRQNWHFQRWTKMSLAPGKTRTIVLSNHNIQIPEMKFNTIYVLEHIWHHFIAGGIGLRQLCDWATLLHASHQEQNENYKAMIESLDELEAYLKQFGLYEAWQLFGCLAVRRIGLPVEEFPLYDVTRENEAEELWHLIRQEGNFGHFSDSLNGRPRGFIKGKLHSLRRITRRTFSLMKYAPIPTFNYYVYFLRKGVRGFFQALFKNKRA